MIDFTKILIQITMAPESIFVQLVGKYFTKSGSKVTYFVGTWKCNGKIEMSLNPVAERFKCCILHMNIGGVRMRCIVVCND